MGSEFGPWCTSCGHPANYHNTRRCTFTPEGGMMSCDCHGYKPADTNSLDTELLEINRMALMDIRDIADSMAFAAPEMWSTHLRRLKKVLQRVGL